MKMWLLFPALLLAVAVHAAEPLKLGDGRQLPEWSIVAQTPGTVTVKYRGGVAKVPKPLLPADLLAKYPVEEEAAKVEAAENAEAARAYQEQVAAIEAKKEREHAERLARIAEKAAVRGSAGGSHQGQTVVVVNPAAKPALSQEEKIEKSVRERADRFFRYDYQAGSGYLYVIETSVSDLEITPKPGWMFEFTVTGKGYLQYYDSVPHGQFKRDQREFIAEVNTKGANPRVTSFRQK